MTTASPRAAYVTINNGRLASIHTSRDAAVKAAAKTGALMLSVERDAFGRRPDLAVGDKVRGWHGMVLPA